MEKMTNDFSNLFRPKIEPDTADLYTIANGCRIAVNRRIYLFTKLAEDSTRLNDLRAIQGLPNTVYPRVNIHDGPYSGLYER